jgi:3',5'-cyclic AMP phosphodiesterase CpdA
MWLIRIPGRLSAGPILSLRAATGNAPITPATSFYIRGYSEGEQTRWLETTLRKASEEKGIDWIVVQTHYGALSSTKTGYGSDKGAREEWLPLFDKYGVDLVLCGHDHDYERSYPVRGANQNV